MVWNKHEAPETCDGLKLVRQFLFGDGIIPMAQYKRIDSFIAGFQKHPFIAIGFQRLRSQIGIRKAMGLAVADQDEGWDVRITDRFQEGGKLRSGFLLRGRQMLKVVPSKPAVSGGGAQTMRLIQSMMAGAGGLREVSSKAKAELAIDMEDELMQSSLSHQAPYIVFMRLPGIF